MEFGIYSKTIGLELPGQQNHSKFLVPHQIDSERPAEPYRAEVFILKAVQIVVQPMQQADDRKNRQTGKQMNDDQTPLVMQQNCQVAGRRTLGREARVQLCLRDPIKLEINVHWQLAAVGKKNRC